MSDSIEVIKGRIQALEEELALIRPTSWNHQKISDRRHALELLDMQLRRVEAMHQTFLDYRAELVCRHHDFARKGGR